MAMVHVSGIEAGQVILFALSTCVWCKKTKQLLDDLHVAYDYEYVDLLQGSDRDLAVETVRKWNNTCSFPTLIIHNKCIVGYDEKEIREALKQ
jgi:glutaredoxin-like protein NrdH